MSRTSRTYPERCEFEMNPHQAHSLSPPVYQLPTEIISHIFKLYLAPVPFDMDDLAEVDVYASLKLGAVCSTWRQIAWSTPQLWTVVPAFFSREPDRNSANCDLIKAWMERAMMHPLHVIVRCGMEESHTEDDALMEQLWPIIHLINTYSHRWQTLDLDMLPCVLLENIQCSQASSHLQAWRLIFSDLDYFDLYIASDEQEESDEDGGGPDKDLSHFYTSRIRRRRIRRKLLDISWTNLTVFFSNGLFSIQCYHFLENAPQLTSATFLNVIYDESSTVSTGRPFTCSSLSYLRVHSLVDNTDHFLDNITFPALKHLRVEFLGFNNFLQVTTFFQQQASTSLTSLAINVEGDFPSELRCRKALKVPNVTRLMLSGFDMIGEKTHNKTFLSHLGRSCRAVGCDLVYGDNDGHSPILPNLQHLTIQDTGRDDDQYPFLWHDILAGLKKAFVDHFDNQIHSALKSITLSISPVSGSNISSLGLEMDVVSEFIDVIKSGVPLRIINDFGNRTRVDLIQTAMEFHKFSTGDIEKYLHLAASIEVDVEDWRDWGVE